MKNKCKICGYEWDSIKDVPKCCPRCKRYDWDNNVSIIAKKGGGNG